MSTIIKEKQKTDVREKTKAPWHIVVYNDDVNTFEHVINCLIKYCQHEETQAIQCTYMVHHNGKCSVKQGGYDQLRPIYEALLDNHLSVKIEET